MEREIENLNIVVPDKSLSKIIKNEKMFKKENKFSRVEYEKFLVKNSLSAVGFEKSMSNQIKKQLSDHYALRDIISNNDVDLSLCYKGKCKENNTEYCIKYTEPNDKQLLVESNYILKKYDNAQATLKIYSTNQYNPDQAILVKSDSTVYCKTTFDRNR